MTALLKTDTLPDQGNSVFMTGTISSSHIAAALSPQAEKIAIEIVDETGSTSTDLLDRVPVLTSPVLRLARRQTAGRGRNGKSWHSAPDASLTFSLAWPFSRPAEKLAGLSLAIGVSLAKTLRQMDIPVMLKWPNDILRDGKKLAGILVERPSGTGRQKQEENWIIIGIGINLQLPDELETRIGQPAAEARWLSGMNKNLLIAALMNHLAETLSLFDRHGLAVFADPWNELHAYSGQKVILFQDGQPKQSGTAVGIDEFGRLILEEQGNRMTFSAGNISLRPENA